MSGTGEVERVRAYDVTRQIPSRADPVTAGHSIAGPGPSLTEAHSYRYYCNLILTMDNTVRTKSAPTHSDPGHDPEHQRGPTAVHHLSTSQERKLVDYLEDHLLDITRNYKKRCVFRLLDTDILLTCS